MGLDVALGGWESNPLLFRLTMLLKPRGPKLSLDLGLCTSTGIECWLGPSLLLLPNWFILPELAPDWSILLVLTPDWLLLLSRLSILCHLLEMVLPLLKLTVLLPGEGWAGAG